MGTDLRLTWTTDGVELGEGRQLGMVAWADVGAHLGARVQEVAAGADSISIDAPSGLVAVAGGGSLLRILTGADPDTAPDAGWLTGRLPGGAVDWEAAVGAAPAADWMLAKLSWLHRSDTAVWAEMAQALTPLAWVVTCLTGAAVTDAADAAGTGAWAGGAFRPDLLAIVDKDRDWSSALPEVVPAGSPLGSIAGMAVRSAR